MTSKIRILFVLLFLTLSNSTSFGQSYKNELGIMSDNDYYVDSEKDRYYSEGAFTYFRHALRQENLDPRLNKKIIDFELGHKIYTPYSSHAPDPKSHDRPFAGYAYASGSMGFFFTNQSILKARIQLGILGPKALGKEVQSTFHKDVLKAYYTVEGWEYQVKNEVGLNVDLAYQRLFYQFDNHLLDLSGTSSVQLGNTFSGANAGLLIRFGKLNAFYESSYANSRIKNKPGDKSRTPLEFYVFTKPQVNFVAYNATIQGGLFRSNKGPITFGIKNLVYAQQIGLNFAWWRLSAKAIVTLKSKEVESNAKAYNYGSGVIAYHFN
ncbi:lipid A deacylase LpxR family protein [Pedobacter sp. Du54]|uniref:lipid A deacylase LpxR family protein n=1 Tax=Pedobacter anseongensis TaxID=3133439 RepID=UPI0030A5BE0E